MKVESLSHVQLFVTPWTAAYQAPPSMGFSRQEYWSGVPSPSPIILLIGSKTKIKNLTIFFFKLDSEEKITNNTWLINVSDKIKATD